MAAVVGGLVVPCGDASVLLVVGAEGSSIPLEKNCECLEDDGALVITESADKPWIFQFDRALDLLLKCSIRRKARAEVDGS